MVGRRLAEAVVTTPTFVLESRAEVGAVVEVPEKAHHHLVHVLRLAPGATLQALMAGTGTAVCTLIEASSKRALVRVESLQLAPKPDVELVLIASPLKHKGAADYVAFAGEVGIQKVILTPMRRSVARIERDQTERYQRIANEAARGIGQTIIPRIEVASSLDQAIRLANADRLFYFWEDGGEPIADLRLAGPSTVAFVVGPEGGFDAVEAAQLQHENATALHMKGPLYRASTAIVLGTALLLKAADRL